MAQRPLSLAEDGIKRPHTLTLNSQAIQQFTGRTFLSNSTYKMFVCSSTRCGGRSVGEKCGRPVGIRCNVNLVVCMVGEVTFPSVGRGKEYTSRLHPPVPVIGACRPVPLFILTFVYILACSCSLVFLFLRTCSGTKIPAITGRSALADPTYGRKYIPKLRSVGNTGRNRYYLGSKPVSVVDCPSDVRSPPPWTPAVSISSSQLKK